MATYWKVNLAENDVCPSDYHHLLVISYQSKTYGPVTGYHCSYCDNSYIQYKGAEIAAQHPEIIITNLPQQEQKRIQKLRKEAEAEKADQLAKQKRAQEEERKKKKEEEERKKRRLEEQRCRKIVEIKEKILSAFSTDFFTAESEYKKLNTERLLSESDFNQLKIDYISGWFSKNVRTDEIIPDEEQCAAIGTIKENTEVVARAGSGKTATIVNRFRFLTEHCKADASSILILAFNRKAVDDLRDKIKELYPVYAEHEKKMPHIMTFHALAYSIVHPQETLIYDDEEAGAKTLSYAVQDIINVKIRDEAWVSKIREVMLLHFKGNWEAIETGGHNLSMEKQLIYRRSIPNQTLNNEYVKSYGEKVIANILFEHDIEYKYEKFFDWGDGSPYRPDFTVYSENKQPIIIEYFGLAGLPDYDEQILRKKEYWSNKQIAMIEVFPSEVAGETDTLTKKLLGFLIDYGVVYRKLTEEEIWEKVKKRAIDEFTKAITSFIGRCRKKDLSVESLSKRIREYKSELPTETMFLEIACKIYEEYLMKLQCEKLEDFDGLMSRAVQHIYQGNTSFDKRNSRGDLKSLSYIMIDEYQDFSFLFDQFLDAIRTVCPQASMFCVGDDWQAINAFAGSDIEYFQHFTKRYKDSDRYYLKTNYRSKKEIVSVATHLMVLDHTANNIKAANKGTGKVRLGYISSFELSPVEQSIHQSDKITPAVLRLVADILDNGKNVVFLMRTNDRLPVGFTCRVDVIGTVQERFLASIRSFFPLEKRLTSDNKERITSSTTHKYKGKQNDAVIILDAVMGFYPLIHPAWVFQRIFGDTIEKLIEGEKRLFYVALSRAKEDLFILTTKGEESPFLSDLGQLNLLNWNDYVPVKTNEVSVKIEVGNQKNYGPAPTIDIHELLKSENFKWDTHRKTWYRYFEKDKFDISSVLKQAWTDAANHVVLVQYDENDQVQDGYLFADQTVKRLSVDEISNNLSVHNWIRL